MNSDKTQCVGEWILLSKIFLLLMVTHTRTDSLKPILSLSHIPHTALPPPCALLRLHGRVATKVNSAVNGNYSLLPGTFFNSRHVYKSGASASTGLYLTYSKSVSEWQLSPSLGNSGILGRAQLQVYDPLQLSGYFSVWTGVWENDPGVQVECRE